MVLAEKSSTDLVGWCKACHEGVPECHMLIVEWWVGGSGCEEISSGGGGRGETR